MSNKKRTGEETSTSITLQSSLYKAVKHLAIEEGKTIRDIVAEALEAYLQSKQCNE